MFSLIEVLGLLDNPLVNYLVRLQKIYTLDLEVLDRLIALLKGVNVEVSAFSQTESGRK